MFQEKVFTYMSPYPTKGLDLIEIYTQSIDDVRYAVAINRQEIVTSTFALDERTALHSILSNLPFNVAFQVFHEPSTQAKTTLKTIKDIYEGKEANTNLPLSTTHLPAYTKKVLKVTMAIPVGYVTSYGAIAKAVGGGARAVGNAMAGNLFPPIVPCHRVVKSDLSLGGYGAGGLRVKLEFLRRESQGYSEPKKVDVDDSQLFVFPVEYVLRKFV
jgi:O-6-methylguanine DNA methyltransferase